jgi:hypothetical protein
MSREMQLRLVGHDQLEGTWSSPTSGCSGGRVFLRLSSTSREPEEIISDLQHAGILPVRESSGRGVAAVLNRLPRAGHWLRMLDLSGDTPVQSRLAPFYTVADMNRVETYLLREFPSVWAKLRDDFRSRYRYLPDDPDYRRWVRTTPVEDMRSKIEQREIEAEWSRISRREQQHQEKTLADLRSFRDHWVRR